MARHSIDHITSNNSHIDMASNPVSIQSRIVVTSSSIKYTVHGYTVLLMVLCSLAV